MAVPEKPKGSPPLTEIGGTGADKSGFFNEQDVLRDLQWPYCIKKYNEMAADALIAGALFAIKQYIKSVEWDVKEYSGSNAPSDAKEQAEFLRSIFLDMDKSFSETIDDILSFLQYGFSVHEIVYKKRLGMNQSSKKYRSKYNDGRYGIRKLPIRSQDTLTFNEKCYDSDGEIYRVHQQDFYSGIDTYIPENRFLHFRTTSYKDNPYGRSILYAAYRAYYYRKNIENIEAIGVERTLAGIPVIRIPAELMSPDASVEEKQLRRMYETAGANLKKNDQAYVLLPSSVQGNEDSGNGKYHYDISLLKGDGSNNTSAGTSQIIERWDRRIMQSMLTDFILTGSQSVGSYALASTKVDAFVTAISSYLETISAQFNEKLIPMLWEINGWDSTKAPKLVNKGIDKYTVEALADFLKKTLDSGAITPDQSVEDFARDFVGIQPYQPDAEGSRMNAARQQAESLDENTNQNSNDSQ